MTADGANWEEGPTKESNTLVRIGRGCRTKAGVVDNFLGINSEDLVSHGMPNTCSNTNHMTKSLARFRGEIRIINLVVNLFLKMKSKKGANIHSGTSSALQRNTVNGSTVGVVQGKADIEEAKPPSACRCTSMVKNGVGSSLDSLKVPFSWILVLLMGFTLPASNKKGTKDVLNLFTDFNLSTITDELVRCTTFMDVILQSIDKLLVSHDIIDVTDHGVTSNKELCNSNPTVNGRGIGMDSISSH